MVSSDSEDFESADEGVHVGPQDKKERKKRKSSSNYCDSGQESDSGSRTTIQPAAPSKLSVEVKKTTTEPTKTSEGWEDFDVDCEDTVKAIPKASSDKAFPSIPFDTAKKSTNSEVDKSGWDDFDDWGQEEGISDYLKMNEPSRPKEDKIKSVADRLSGLSTGPEPSKPQQSAWGWGNWGVDSLLSSATAGISTITSHVSQGISTVLESGLGAPDPEEMARAKVASESEVKAEKPISPTEKPSNTPEDSQVKEPTAYEGAFGNILSGVTKFVETTGTKVISGGLDTLETIGKKTMEVLQDGDPGLAKKRAMLGLDPADKPVLSQVLREAKDKADEEDRFKEEKREAKEVHYETLFDDFEGLVHLEALEMLSRQVSMRLEEQLRGADAEKRQDIKETLQQVAELCEMPDSDDEDESADDPDVPKPEALGNRLLEATQDLGIKLQFQPLVKQYSDALEWLSGSESEKAVYKRAVSCLAQGTALSVEVYHKSCEMLLVKTRRSTADEADALTQMTVVLTRHISDLASHFTEKLNALSAENKSDQLNTYITNIFLEAGNSSTYIQNAFQLTLPILQIGAA